MFGFSTEELFPDLPDWFPPLGEMDFPFTYGGRWYVYRYVHQCKTCRCRSRTLIEDAVIADQSYRAAAALADPVDRPSYSSVRRHFLLRHTPIDLCLRDALRDMPWAEIDREIARHLARARHNQVSVLQQAS